MRKVENTNNLICVVTLSIFSCAFFYMIKQTFAASFIIATFSKIMIFITIPIIYYELVHNSGRITNLLKLKVDKKQLLYGLCLGVFLFFLVIFMYILLNQWVDLEKISSDLIRTNKITKSNFIFAAIYITFGNSFIEEFFFRGFIFLNLRKLGNIKFAYIFSAILFSSYHISIFVSWFSIHILILVLISLFAGGLVLNYINTKSESIYNSWLVHIFADIAIIAIGFYMFNKV